MTPGEAGKAVQRMVEAQGYEVFELSCQPVGGGVLVRGVCFRDQAEFKFGVVVTKPPIPTVQVEPLLPRR